MQRFELKDAKSSKFWEVEVQGTELRVCFGRIGTAGQTNIKSFADQARAAKERDTLIKEKLGKGYSEVEVPSSSATSAPQVAVATVLIAATALDGLPPLLRDPPWLRGERAAALPTFHQPPLSTPERIEWSPQQRNQYRTLQPNLQWYYPEIPQEEPARQHRLLELLGLREASHVRLLAGELVTSDDMTQEHAAGSSDLLLALPDTVAIALWNSYPTPDWLNGTDVIHVARALLARHDLAALPGFVTCLTRLPVERLHLAQGIDTPRLVPLMLHALRNLKSLRASAAQWLKAYPRTTLVAGLPVAFGATLSERANAEYGVRWLAQNGHADLVREVAAEYGGPMVPAAAALLAVDPLLVLPAQLPKLPAFFIATAVAHPHLKNGGTLPDAALEHIATMLAISKPDELYAGITVVQQACTPESLANFAWDVFERWLEAGAPAKESWAFTALAIFGNDATADRLTPKIREWPGQSAHHLAVTGLDVLATIGSDVALMHLNGIATKVKFKALQERARKKVEIVAAARGFTAEELADRLVPDLGLDAEGSLRLDFGPRQFQVAFDATLQPFVRDAQGVHLTGLPKALKSDDADLAAAATERYQQLKKDAKAMASMQVVRFEQAMIARRRWRAAEFRALLLEHPLLRHLLARLVWGVYVDGRLTDAFRVAEDWTFADRGDERYELAVDATVGIAHMLEMPVDWQRAFGQIFADYEILQPWKQLGREVYSASSQELAAMTLTRFKDKRVATGSVLGLVNRGWVRGQAEDGGCVSMFTKPLGDYEVELRLDPGTTVDDVSVAPVQKLPALHLRKRDEWSGQGTIPFGQLDPIVLSEVLRDIDLLVTVE